MRELLTGVLEFVGEVGGSGWPPNWEPASASKLWQYNLHYHDWLWSLDEGGEGGLGVEGVRDWVARYPLRKGAVGWDPYPISLRLQNWVLLLFSGRMGEGLAEELWSSLWFQARRLEKRLEWHLLGNHLFENAVTLALLGVTFGGRDGARWRRKGFGLLRREVIEQIPADGMHFELSPMYHLRVMWCLGMLDGLGDEELSGIVGEPLRRAREAHEWLVHPDGEIALVNDSGLGIYAGVEVEQRLGAWALRDAGYYGFRGHGGDYVICDAGKLGPDYIPGHAHADCLSFELSLGGKRVVTDTGVSDYRVSETRDWIRSTAAHSTVEIDGEDQAEMWGAFRVGRRGYPENVRWEPREDGFLLSAAHTGYRKRRSRATHERCFEFGGQRLRIRDEVRGRGRFEAVGRLHLAPGCEVTQEGEGWRLQWEEGSAQIHFDGRGTVVVGESPYYEYFGVRQDRVMIEYRVEVEGEDSWVTELAW